MLLHSFTDIINFIFIFIQDSILHRTIQHPIFNTLCSPNCAIQSINLWNLIYPKASVADLHSVICHFFQYGLCWKFWWWCFTPIAVGILRLYRIPISTREKHCVKNFQCGLYWKKQQITVWNLMLISRSYLVWRIYIYDCNARSVLLVGSFYWLL